MINAAIVGLGWWGKNIVNAVQGKSDRVRFVRGVSIEPEPVRAFAAQHGLDVDSDGGKLLHPLKNERYAPW